MAAVPGEMLDQLKGRTLLALVLLRWEKPRFRCQVLHETVDTSDMKLAQAVLLGLLAPINRQQHRILRNPFPPPLQTQVAQGCRPRVVFERAAFLISVRPAQRNG